MSLHLSRGTIVFRCKTRITARHLALLTWGHIGRSPICFLIRLKHPRNDSRIQGQDEAISVWSNKKAGEVACGDKTMIQTRNSYFGRLVAPLRSPCSVTSDNSRFCLQLALGLVCLFGQMEE